MATQKEIKYLRQKPIENIHKELHSQGVQSSRTLTSLHLMGQLSYNMVTRALRYSNNDVQKAEKYLTEKLKVSFNRFG